MLLRTRLSWTIFLFNGSICANNVSLHSPVLSLSPLLYPLTHAHLCLPVGQMVRAEEGPSCEAGDGRGSNMLRFEEHLSSTE